MSLRWLSFSLNRISITFETFVCHVQCVRCQYRYFECCWPTSYGTQIGPRMSNRIQEHCRVLPLGGGTASSGLDPRSSGLFGCAFCMYVAAPLHSTFQTFQEYPAASRCLRLRASRPFPRMGRYRFPLAALDLGPPSPSRSRAVTGCRGRVWGVPCSLIVLAPYLRRTGCVPTEPALVCVGGAPLVVSGQGVRAAELAAVGWWVGRDGCARVPHSVPVTVLEIFDWEIGK